MNNDTPDTQALRIVLADKDPAALRVTASQVRDLGHTPIEIAVDPRAAVEAIVRDDPDVAIVVIYEDDDYALELIEEMAEYASGPVIAVLDHEDSAFVGRAAESGIFAYARQDTTESIQSAIEVAVRRWHERRALDEKVDRLEGALERRAVIERAKGILMERHGIEARTAFDLMRDSARSNNRTVVAVAGAVADGRQLLPGRPDGP